jgi:hypothetical protein
MCPLAIFKGNRELTKCYTQITCVKSSQGFEWSSDIFLPSYANDRDSRDLERRQDPVEDIIVTDEEIANWLPQ